MPDPRLLIKGDAQPTALVQRLLDGPSAALAAGVRNPLTGVQLRSAVTVAGPGGRRRPDRPAGRPGAGAVGDLRADRLDARAADVRTVEIRVDGEPVDIAGVPAQQTVEDWAAFDPDAVPLDAVGHYLSGGALHTVTTGARARTGRHRAPTGSPARRCRPTRAPASCRSWSASGQPAARAARRPVRRRARAVLTARRSARRPSPPPGRRRGWCATAPTWSACRRRCGR